MTRKEAIGFLKSFNERIEELKTHLMAKWGDEAHDVGDASNILELLSNTVLYTAYVEGAEGVEPHDSYTIFEQKMANFVAAAIERSSPPASSPRGFIAAINQVFARWGIVLQLGQT